MNEMLLGIFFRPCEMLQKPIGTPLDLRVIFV